MREDGILGKKTPKREELVYILGQPRDFSKHIFELHSFKDVEFWTDGTFIAVRKTNKEAIDFVCKCLPGKVVDSSLVDLEYD